MIFSLKLQGLFGDKGKSTGQVALKTIINTRIHVILAILPDSFQIGKKILEEWKGVHIKFKVLQTLLLRRRATTPNKENSRKEMREQTRGH